MRGRLLKPDFFVNEELARCHPLARLLYEGCWCAADIEGKLEYRPEKLRGQVFPHEKLDYWNVTMDGLLLELMLTKHLLPYQGANGRWICKIPTAPKHFPKVKGGKKYSFPDPPKNYKLSQQLKTLFEKLPKTSEYFQKFYPEIEIETETETETEIPPPKPPKGGSRAEPTKPGEFIPGKTKPYPELFEMVIADLNAVAGTNYSPTTTLTKEKITARWNEGFDLGAFRHVHRVKFAQWGDDPKRKEFIRPPTLYSRKFESYLNQEIPEKLPYSQITAENIKTLKETKLT